MFKPGVGQHRANSVGCSSNWATSKTYRQHPEFLLHLSAFQIYTSTSGLLAAKLDCRLPVASRSNELSAVNVSVSENTDAAAEISLLSHLESEILTGPVWEPPSWISDFRLHYVSLAPQPLKSLMSKMRVSILEFCFYLFQYLRYMVVDRRQAGETVDIFQA